MTRILVTGGAGYIGSHTCKALARAGYVPVTCDNLVTGERDAVKFGPFEQGDLLDRALWRRWSGDHRRSRVEIRMHRVKLPGQSLPARDFDRQVAELQVRIVVLNGYTALGIPVTEAAG